MNADPLARARALVRLLDASIGIPGTRIRFGLDPLLGLIPGLGDVAGAAMGGYIVLLAGSLGAPSSVVMRMLANIALDTVVGAIPLAGDVFDFGWKSNTRNLALLERYVEQPAATHAASRNVMIGIVVGMTVLAAGAAVVAMALVRLAVGLIR